METTTAERAIDATFAKAAASRDPEVIASLQLASTIALCNGHHASAPHRDMLAAAIALYRVAVIHATASAIMKETSTIEEVPLAIVAAYKISGEEMQTKERQLANLTEALFGRPGPAAGPKQ